MCQEHSVGPLCAQCEPHYKFDQTGLCKLCANSSSGGLKWTAIVTMVAIVLVILLSYYIMLRLGDSTLDLVRSLELKAGDFGSAPVDLSTTKRASDIDLQTQKVEMEAMMSRRSPNFTYKFKILVSFCQVAFEISQNSVVTWPYHFVQFMNVFKSLFHFLSSTLHLLSLSLPPCGAFLCRSLCLS